MGRAQEGGKPREQARRQTGVSLPKAVRDALPAPVARAWKLIVPHLPPEMYLAGGTATALYLGHRESNDLDFFFHSNAVDLDALEQALTSVGAVVNLRSPGTLRVYIGATKIEVLHADEARQQHQLGPTQQMGGLAVASIEDLMAMKLKVLSERGELRDYYDVKDIDERGGISVEEGLALFRERYGLDEGSVAVRQLILALGYLEDCDEDESLPMTKQDLATWWRERQALVIRNLGW